MRLLSVRAWLNGQSWFDMTQYRLLAPEGLSLHWSRYGDLGPALTLRALEAVLPPHAAERWMALAWPTALALMLHALVGFGTRAHMGAVAGAVAMAVLAAWAMVSSGYFAPGRLDHHNLQILLMGVAAFAVLSRKRPVLGGGVCAGALALSLAIGLEGVLFGAAIGSLIVIQSALDLPSSRARMTGFCASLAPLAVCAHLGQTPPERWGVPVCDALGPAILGVLAVGSVAGLSLYALPLRARKAVPVLALAAGLLALGLALLWAQVSPCLAGPYASLPGPLQILIAQDLAEALPAYRFAQRFPGVAVDLLWPAGAAVIIGALGVAVSPTGALRRSGLTLLILCLVGTLAALMQVRQVILLAAIAPALTGFGLQALITARRRERSPLAALGVLGALALLMLPLVAKDVLQARPNAGGQIAAQDQGCALPSTLSGLNAVPPTAILTPLNLGPKLLLATHHTGLAAPYHRSARALGNGVLPFRGTPQDMGAVLSRERADLVLVCAGSQYGPATSVGSLLAAGSPPPSFAPVPLGDGPLRLYRWRAP